MPQSLSFQIVTTAIHFSISNNVGHLIVDHLISTPTSTSTPSTSILNTLPKAIIGLSATAAFCLPSQSTQAHVFLLECIAGHFVLSRVLKYRWPGDNIYSLVFNLDTRQNAQNRALKLVMSSSSALFVALTHETVSILGPRALMVTMNTLSALNNLSNQLASAVGTVAYRMSSVLILAQENIISVVLALPGYVNNLTTAAFDVLLSSAANILSLIHSTIDKAITLSSINYHRMLGVMHHVSQDINSTMTNVSVAITHLVDRIGLSAKLLFELLQTATKDIMFLSYQHASTCWEAVSTTTLSLRDGTVDFVSGLWTAVQVQFTALANLCKVFSLGILQALQSCLLQITVTFINPIKRLSQLAFSAAIEAPTSIRLKHTEAVIFAEKEILQAATHVETFLGTVASQTLHAYVDTGAFVFECMINAYKALIAAPAYTVEKLADACSFVLRTLEGIVLGTMDLLGQCWEGMETWCSHMLESIKSFQQELVNLVWVGAGTILNLARVTQKGAEALGREVVDGVSQAISRVAGLVGTAVMKVIEGFEHTLNVSFTFGAKGLEAITQLLQQLARQLGLVVDYSRSVGLTIALSVKPLPGKLYAVFLNALQTFGRGLFETSNSVMSCIKSGISYASLMATESGSRAYTACLELLNVLAQSVRNASDAVTSQTKASALALQTILARSFDASSKALEVTGSTVLSSARLIRLHAASSYASLSFALSNLLWTLERASITAARFVRSSALSSSNVACTKLGILYLRLKDDTSLTLAYVERGIFQPTIRASANVGGRMSEMTKHPKVEVFAKAFVIHFVVLVSALLLYQAVINNIKEDKDKAQTRYTERDASRAKEPIPNEVAAAEEASYPRAGEEELVDENLSPRSEFRPDVPFVEDLSIDRDIDIFDTDENPPPFRSSSPCRTPISAPIPGRRSSRRDERGSSSFRMPSSSTPNRVELSLRQADTRMRERANRLVEIEKDVDNLGIRVTNDSKTCPAFSAIYGLLRGLEEAKRDVRAEWNGVDAESEKLTFEGSYDKRVFGKLYEGDIDLGSFLELSPTSVSGAQNNRTPLTLTGTSAGKRSGLDPGMEEVGTLESVMVRREVVRPGMRFIL